MQAEPLRPVRERLDVPRHRIVGLVAVHVDEAPVVGRELAEDAHALGTIGHRALEMRYAADDVDAERERTAQVRERARRAQHSILRKRDELHVEIGLHARANVDQRLDGEQPRITDVDMRADREQALGDGPVAVRERALDDRVLRERGLQLAPQRDPFEQRSAGVDARHPVRQRRVHVEMRVDERRRQQVAAAVERARSGCVQCGTDGYDPACADQHVLAAAAIGLVAVGFDAGRDGAPSFVLAGRAGINRRSREC